MSLRAKYLTEQAERESLRQSPSPLQLLSGEGKTRMILVVRDKDGTPQFSDDFPEDIKRELLKQLSEE